MSRFTLTIFVKLILETKLADLDVAVDAMMASLLATDDLAAVGVGADREGEEVQLRFSLEADDLGGAIQHGLTLARAALHAAGVATPDWEKLIDRVVADQHLDDRPRALAG